MQVTHTKVTKQELQANIQHLQLILFWDWYNMLSKTKGLFLCYPNVENKTKFRVASK